MARQDFKMDEGATFSRRVVHIVADVPVDLTGYSGRCSIRSEDDNFSGRTITTDQPRFGTLSLAADGGITVAISPEETRSLARSADFAALTMQMRGRGERHVFYYDITVTAPDGTATRAAEGRIILNREQGE